MKIQNKVLTTLALLVLFVLLINENPILLYLVALLFLISVASVICALWGADHKDKLEAFYKGEITPEGEGWVRR